MLIIRLAKNDNPSTGEACHIPYLHELKRDYAAFDWAFGNRAGLQTIHSVVQIKNTADRGANLVSRIRLGNKCHGASRQCHGTFGPCQSELQLAGVRPSAKNIRCPAGNKRCAAWNGRALRGRSGALPCHCRRVGQDRTCTPRHDAERRTASDAVEDRRLCRLVATATRAGNLQCFHIVVDCKERTYSDSLSALGSLPVVSLPGCTLP